LIDCFDIGSLKDLRKQGFQVATKEQNMEKVNVKQDFAKWLLNNAPVSYNHYLGGSTNSIVERLNEITAFFPEQNFFELDPSKVNRLIQKIKLTFSTKERRNNPEFMKYDTHHSNGIPKAVMGKNNYLRFLRENFRKNSAINYWIFQGNPKVFDFEAALQDGTLNNFTVSAHKDKIKEGDKVIIWLSGQKAGCYALAEITSEPSIISESSDDKHWKKENSNNLKAGIKITHNLYENPILWEDIKEEETFANFKAGHQGTNFTTTKEEYEILLNMAEKTKLNREKIFDALRKKMENAGFLFEDKQQTHGQSRKEKELKFTHPRLIKKFEQDGLNNNAFKFYIKPLSDEENCEIGFAVGKTSPLFHASIFSKPNAIDTLNNYQAWVNRANDFALDKLLISINDYLSNRSMKYPLNQIIFGPPGTGKTYKLQSKYFKQFTKYESTTSKDDYLVEHMEPLAWWQVLFIALLDLDKVGVKDILSHPAILAKAKSTSIQNLRASLWGTLQRHTKDDCEHVNVKSRAAIKPFWKSEDSLWHLYSHDELDLFPEAQEILDKYNNYESTSGQEIKNYTFVTFHQSFTYEDFVEGIKPVLGDDNEDLRYEISDGVFKRLAVKAHNDPENDYAIFIDEINRGNVASIFGELITLIESDKRAGSENELSVVLPYSKTKFSVPSNLHIIGTMNTADRSIEALDSALRRRFEFEEMLPKYDVIDKELNNLEFEGFKLSDILRTINERITILINRDHQIGHSYFLKLRETSNLEDDLKQVFVNKIIPLLQEYFFNDYIKMVMVLGEGFMEKDNYSNVKFAQNDGDYDTDYDDVINYDIKKDIDLSSAIKLLMGENADA
jgi:hypothetical protein